MPNIFNIYMIELLLYKHKMQTMKKSKIICAVIILLMTFPAMSQEVVSGGEKKWGTELNFNPFNGSLSLNNSTGQIKVRRFLSDEIALRVGVVLAWQNYGDEVEQKYTQTPYTSSDKKQSLQTIINFGIEKHFLKGKHLSPYLGAEAGIGFKRSKHEMELNEKKRTIDGAWQSSQYNGQYYIQSFEENNYISAGANFLTGFDFYMVENFYFGYEFGFGVEYKRFGNIEITQDEDYSSYNETPLPKTKSSSWRLAPNLINGIRIGYNF